MVVLVLCFGEISSSKKFRNILLDIQSSSWYTQIKRKKERTGSIKILTPNETKGKDNMTNAMKDLYENQPMNQPRCNTDRFFVDYANEYQYRGLLDDAFRYIEGFQLLDSVLWDRFVDQFRQEDADHDRGWRGEYWGKMMRGACFVYSYTKNPKLYEVLTKTVRDIIGCAEESGRISSYGSDHEFDGWDLWSRKYVLLGMQYFYEICTDDDLKEQIVVSMRGQVDYIMSLVGNPKEGKRLHITQATRNWRGLNSSSLLEPVVRLYTLTGDKAYFDFATYIVNHGGTDVFNVFDYAYKNEFAPYQYPVTKAYEMISCFEGLLEYYRITGIEKYKTAIVNFANRILETDFTIIGCCGCTHELFDHATVRQANTTNGIMQETCVTVTLMKYLYQVHLLTGDPKYMDAFEVSLYNAYLGSINTEKATNPNIYKKNPDVILEPLPFDSYSPLAADTRGNQVGGLCVMSDRHYYGCCACIGAAGIGLVTKTQMMTTRGGFALNLYVDGTVCSTTPEDRKITFKTETSYPKGGSVSITLEMEQSEVFELMIRIPEWSKKSELTVNGKKVPILVGYTSIVREWMNGDVIELTLDMRTRAMRPIPYGEDILMNEVVWSQDYVVPKLDREDPLARKHVALLRGPITLAQENRLGYSVDDPIEVEVDEDGYVDVELPEEDLAPYKHIIEVRVPLTDGSKMAVTDYSSAGKLWTEESKMAAWMLTK